MYIEFNSHKGDGGNMPYHFDLNFNFSDRAPREYDTEIEEMRVVTELSGLITSSQDCCQQSKPKLLLAQKTPILKTPSACSHIKAIVKGYKYPGWG